MKTHIDEHKAAVQHAKCDDLAVAEHVWAKKHQMDFQSASILAHEMAFTGVLVYQEEFHLQ